MGRIVDKIDAWRKKNRRNTTKNKATTSDGVVVPFFYSFEFFPPKTEAGLDNLLARIDRMSSRLDPLFIDVTYGAAGSTIARTIAVASHAQRYCGVDVLMHLTCTGVTREQIANVLQQAKSSGVHNILALRGDPPRGKRSWEQNDVSGGECERAIDLVKLIRKLHGSYFGIAVAGHPEGHPSSRSFHEEMQHLKEKIEAGADFIITQFFYDTNLFLDYVKRCRECDITCPILPGIMPIQSYNSFVRMTEYCNISVPSQVLDRLNPVKDDDEAVKEIGCEIAGEMCRRILETSPEDGGVDGVHFYTLNLERSVTRILMSMGAVDVIHPTHHNVSINDGSTIAVNGDTTQKKVFPPEKLEESVRASTGRQFPWRPSAMEKRSQEEVRPINWANRPKSYVMRTEDWDEFPNGRWGDSTSPAFGELSEFSHFYSFSLGTEEDRRDMLGNNPTTPQDIYEVFARYVEGGIPHIPWCEMPLQPESYLIQSQLATLNRAGFLTINSQPSVNGAVSTHPTFGWGGPGGVVYQKAYCECFASPENTNRLVEMISNHPSMNLYAVNNSGQELRVGVEEGGITALTWGVFPNREILQPTIFDPSTFLVWAEEAFSLWTMQWLNLYDMESGSYDLIETVRDTYYLVAIIDNDFISATDGLGSHLWSTMLEVANVRE
jgi:methylenetetrahydrofolate reductase (NADPH)